MSYVCDIKHYTKNKKMVKAENFDESLQDLSNFARILSHPARLAILKYLAETKTCISGDISNQLPLSRTTVSQHLKELRDAGIIRGEIEGLKINYCICGEKLDFYLKMFNDFFGNIKEPVSCGC